MFYLPPHSGSSIQAYWASYRDENDLHFYEQIPNFSLLYGPVNGVSIY